MRISKEQSAVLKGIAIWIMASYHIMVDYVTFNVATASRRNKSMIEQL
ncbi:MAG: hypothetical protein II838_13910 [Lachnospiraceae bacterium]|nr:hypothetical protein [Lachnospiraceae bacterium]